MNDHNIAKCLLIIWLGIVLASCQATAGPNTPALPATPVGPRLDIAILAPTTGEMATFGRIMGNGMVMAFDRWNEQGGLLGHRLIWRLYDSGCDFETARQATQQAVAAGHQFIIGPLCSEAAIAAATVAEANRIVMIAPTASHPLVTVSGQGQTRPTIFRAAYAYPWQGQVMARFAAVELSAGTAALLHNPADDYAAALAGTFAQEFTAQGGDIVYQAAYSWGQTDFTEALTAIRHSGAAALYLPVPATTANQIVAQLNQSTMTPAQAEMILLGSDSWQTDTLDATLTAGSYYPLHFTGQDSRPQVQTWSDAYQATYAVAPDTLAALGYDAAHLLAQAIQQAGAVEVTAVAATLEQATFTGVTGPLTFDAQHNPIKPVPVVRVEPDGLVLETVIEP